MQTEPPHPHFADPNDRSFIKGLKECDWTANEETILMRTDEDALL